MPAALFLPLLLRLAGPLSFLSAAMVAGVMNRSLLLIPLIALASTATTVLIRMIAPSPVMDLKSMLDPSAPPEKPNPLQGAGRRFGMSMLGFGLVFGLSALIAAIFQTTEFQQQVQSLDLGFLTIPALIALIGSWLSARLGINQMAGMMQDMQGIFAQMQTGQTPQDPDEDAFTVEGEIIDPEDPKS